MAALQERPRPALPLDADRAGSWLGELADAVDGTRQSQSFQAALDAMARFWRYSPTNAWLIVRKEPRATRVAGRRTWEQLGRRVLPGAQPIRILAPMSARGFPFVVVDVFDIRQTRGRRVPALDLSLRGHTEHAAGLEAAARQLGVVVRESNDTRYLGRSLGGLIEVRAGLSTLERAAVLAHELAHEVLHQHRKAKKRPPSLTRAARETEAEATAYVVLRALGLPSTAPSYIAWQGGEGQVVLRALGRIQRAARHLLEAMMPTVEHKH